MLYPSIDKLLSQVGSKYLLTNIVNKRVKEMEKTGHYQLKEDEYKSEKNIGRALEEVAKGLIIVEEPDPNEKVNENGEETLIEDWPEDEEK